LLLLALGPFVAFFGTGYYTGLGAVTAELYATPIRATGQGFTYNMGRIASAAAPFTVGSLADKQGFGPAFAILAGLSTAHAQTVLKVTTIPEEAATEQVRKFGPLVKYLERTLGTKVEFTPVNDYPAAVEALVNKQVDLVWFGGFTHVQAQIRSGGKIIPIAQREEDTQFRSVFITQTDSGIKQLSDLKGKLIDVIQLVAAIKFLEKLVTAEEALDVLWYALAVSIVILALLAVHCAVLGLAFSNPRLALPAHVAALLGWAWIVPWPALLGVVAVLGAGLSLPAARTVDPSAQAVAALLADLPALDGPVIATTPWFHQRREDGWLAASEPISAALEDPRRGGPDELRAGLAAIGASTVALDHVRTTRNHPGLSGLYREPGPEWEVIARKGGWVVLRAR
jgi:hypothetical protein